VWLPVTDIPSAAVLREEIARAVGPAPWYWKTFPAFRSTSGQRLVWTHLEEPGPLGFVVSLSLEQEQEKPRLALNTYARPFLLPPTHLGVWCPEGPNLRFVCFDPDQLKAFDFAEIAGWFKASDERMYSATAPIMDFEVPIRMPPGIHSLQAPPELRGIDELIVPSSYPAKTADDPAMALFVFYFQAGLVEVLPQLWFTASQYKVGAQWITRAARDQKSHRIFGECHGAGSFLLQQDGMRLDRWLEKD
jgi:hypothetical protein